MGFSFICEFWNNEILNNWYHHFLGRKVSPLRQLSPVGRDQSLNEPQPVESWSKLLLFSTCLPPPILSPLIPRRRGDRGLWKFLIGTGGGKDEVAVTWGGGGGGKGHRGSGEDRRNESAWWAFHLSQPPDFHGSFKSPTRSLIWPSWKKSDELSRRISHWRAAAGE